MKILFNSRDSVFWPPVENSENGSLAWRSFSSFLLAFLSSIENPVMWKLNTGNAYLVTKD
jgi:hypothetical protein